ncbi:AAA family ATPase [Lacticaseibacillus daqingensis]|uniref:AAA family ATPase n=1 Tax=Lacticaseibacillus daqingensis TaxID=2486014 RepID=UPI0013DE600E|nr:AAA family ATPase [Lacticaseibacillus daqingensis]
MATLILIRGNSGSGKTTLAQHLGTALGDQALVLSQDTLRRTVLRAPDHPGTPAIALIRDLIAFGRTAYPVTIVEGILRRDVYGTMLQAAVAAFGPDAWVYYLDVPFAVTVAHNAGRFDAATLRRWWRPDDVLTRADRRLPAQPVAVACAHILKEVHA